MIESLKFETLKQHARTTIERFPFFALLALSAYLICLIDQSGRSPFDAKQFEEALTFIFYISLYGVPMVVASERLSYSSRKAALVATLLGTLTWVMHYMAYTPYGLEIAFTFASITLCSIAPFFKDGDNDRLCYFWYRTITAAMWTVLPCAILSIAIGCLQLTLKSLFGLSFGDFMKVLTYGSVWILLAPLFFFGQLPRPAELDAIRECVAPKPIKLILTWLLIPIALVFFFIIYLYFAKALVTQENVRGTLVNVIIGYSIFGLGVLLSSYPLIAEDNKSAKLLHKYFFAIIAIPAAVLLWRVWVRIDAYGLTIDRIFAIVFAVWLIGIVIAYGMRPIARRQLRFIPMGVALIILLMYAGPWDPQSLTVYAQTKRIVAALKAEGLYENSHVSVKEPKPPIKSLANQRIIIDGFNYLNQIDRGSRNGKYKRPSPLDPFFDGTPLAGKYQATINDYGYGQGGYGILTQFAVPLRDDKGSDRQNVTKSLDFTEMRTRSYNVSGYDVLTERLSIDINCPKWNSLVPEPHRVNNDKYVWFTLLPSSAKSFGTLPLNQEAVYALEAFLDNPNAPTVKAIIRDTKGKEIDILTFDLNPVIAPYLGDQKPSQLLSGVYVTGRGQHFEAVMRVLSWNGEPTYADDSQANNVNGFKTNSVGAEFLLRKR